MGNAGVRGPPCAADMRLSLWPTKKEAYTFISCTYNTYSMCDISFDGKPIMVMFVPDFSREQ